MTRHAGKRTGSVCRRMDITFRRMTKEDIPAVVEIEQLCFSEPWTEADYHESLLLPYAAYYVAEAGDVILGMCGVRKVAGEGQISNVAVKPAFQGQQIARRLLLLLLTDCRREGIQEFTLEVRAGNTRAIALYKGLGFRTEGVRPHFYSKPTEDALIQWLRFR